MLRTLLPIVLLLLCLVAVAQNIGINVNGAAPNASALLDIDVSALVGPKRGLLIPRMTSVERTAIPAPATGLLVYDTSTQGFWYFNGAVWTPLASASAGWTLYGNAGTNPAVNFIGTTDSQPLRFRVNNQNAGRISPGDSTVALGLRAGQSSINAYRNVYIGQGAGQYNTTASDNCFVGFRSGQTTTGKANTFVGSWAGAGITTGQDNTAVGAAAGCWQSGSSWNTCVGAECGVNAQGARNTLLGYYTAAEINGNDNVIVGAFAAYPLTNSVRNTILGAGATVADGVQGSTTIGYNAHASASNSLILGGANVLVGIGVSAPTAELEVNGFTKLGSNAPAIKMLKLTGTSAATQGASVSIPHGLSITKILSVDVLLEYAANAWIPDSYINLPGYTFSVIANATNIVLINQNANSGNILSKPVKILITYEE
ncbi:MAG: hypothetical protein JNM91_08470 [Flavobacteriales bacterium]|nr:hypothetical protein [Flavobacteriales bacterium]